MNNFSNRVTAMQSSPIRKLVPFATAAKAEGVKVYHLNIGQPDIKTPRGFFEAVKNFDNEVLEYAVSQGIPELIEALQDYYKTYDMHFDKDELLITNGGSEALLFAMMATCDPGDKLLIPEPFYTNYNGFGQCVNVGVAPITTKAESEALLFAMMATCDPGDKLLIPEPFYTNYNGFGQCVNVGVAPITTKAENGFHLPSKEEILSKIDDKVKAILLSNPGNPTGAIYSKEELEMIAEIAIEKDLWIISDEVYREFVYDGLEYTSFPGNPTGAIYSKEELEMIAEIAIEKDLWIISDEVYREFVYDGLEYTSFGNLKQVEDRVIIIDSVSKR